MFGIKETLPAVLRSNPFYADLLDCVDEQLFLLHEHIKQEFNSLYNVDNLDEDGLRNLASMFGMALDLTVSESIDDLRRQVSNFAFRRSVKTTYNGYEFFFKESDYSGEVFSMFSVADAEQTKLVRALDASALAQDIEEIQDLDDLFFLKPQLNYFMFFEAGLFMNTGLFTNTSITEELLYADSVQRSRSTNHIALQYNIDRLIERNGQYYTMTPELLNSFFRSIDYNRKVTEIPHVGAQIPLLVNNVPNNNQYTNPEMQIKTTVTSNYSGNSSQFHTVKIGVGSHEVVDETLTDLEKPISQVILNSDEAIDMSDVSIGHTLISVAEEIVIGFGDGQVMTFNGTIPAMQYVTNSILRNSFEVRFFDSEFEIRIVDDAGRLFIEGAERSFPVGTIDYETGEYDFETRILPPNRRTKNIDKVDDDGEGNGVLIFQLEDHTVPVFKEECTITFFRSGFVFSHTAFVDPENSHIGIFEGTNLSTEETSFINFNTGHVEIYFDGMPDEDREIHLDYISLIQYMPGVDTPVRLLYLLEGEVNVTEAGIYNASEELIVYATFPAFSTDNNAYHLSPNFVVIDQT